MKFSFYRNLTWLIGILVAVEIYLKIGAHRGMIPMIADLVIVLILTFLFHRLRVTGVNSGAYDPEKDDNVMDNATESAWQKKHDQWWQQHRQVIDQHVGSTEKTPPKPRQEPSASSNVDSVNENEDIDRLEDSNRALKKRINYLNHKISTLHDDSRNSDSYQDSDWYRQVAKMKRRIAKLKSEYK